MAKPPRTIEQIERDLFWAKHVAVAGNTAEQRARGQARVERFAEELRVARDRIA